MHHKESNTKIYFSDDYALFNMIQGNRPLIERKIAKLKKIILGGLDLLRLCPILCVENANRLDIIDGQHRFFVSRQLKSKVYYVLSERLELTDIAKVNNATEKWSAANYINCFAQNDNEHYNELRNFMDQYRLPLSVCISLLSGKTVKDSGGHHADDFKNGRFVCNTKSKAIEVAELIGQFKEFSGSRSRPFITAITIILDAGIADFDKLIAKFKKDPTKLTRCTSPKDYLSNLETIYNIGAHKRELIWNQ